MNISNCREVQEEQEEKEEEEKKIRWENRRGIILFILDLTNVLILSSM